MADVEVRITRLLADIAGTDRTSTVQARNAREAIDALCTATPALRVHIFDDDGHIRRHVSVFVRGDIARPDALDGALADGDEVAIVQAVSGGAVESATPGG